MRNKIKLNIRRVGLCGWLVVLMIPLCNGCAAISERSGTHTITFAVPEPDTASHATLDAYCHTSSMSDAQVSQVGCPCCQSYNPMCRNRAGFKNPPTRNRSVPSSAARTQNPVMAVPMPAPTADSSIPTQMPVASVAEPVLPLNPVPQEVGNEQVPLCGEGYCPPNLVHTQQIEELTNRVVTLETRLKQNNETMIRLNAALNNANEDVRRLTTSVKHWQDEVKRLDAAMRSQHESDIASITTISKSLELLLADEVGRATGDSGDSSLTEEKSR